ncbi:MAG: hypothetical protein IKP76_03700 [Bacilli bacterium]|nr:hypothetical protein [Bacilli bacterium]
MEKRPINGYSVNNELISGSEFYGEIGTLLGVIEKDEKLYAIIEDKNGRLFSKNVVIETNVVMTKNGPAVTETVYAGEKNIPIPESTEDYIRDGIAKYNNLDFLYEGEVNIDLALAQNDSFFVGEDNFIDYLSDLKKRNPATPLLDSLKEYPYEQEQHFNRI